MTMENPMQKMMGVPDYQHSATRDGAVVAPELEVKMVTKRFGGFAAVDAVSLRLMKGEFLSLLGPSGCGKTTTLRMIAGFVIPDQGTILLRGRNITEDPPYRRDVGLLFQNYALFPHMTIFDNVSFGPRMRRESKPAIRDRVRWALDLVRLSGFDDRRPHELSGGQQQRVAVARVLAAGASILLLDEPFSNLDAKLRLHMQEDLRELQLRLGIATVHVTHDQEEAMMMSDRVIIMNSGRIEQEGTPEQVYRMPSSAFVAEFMGRCNKLSGPLVAANADGLPLGIDLGPAGRLSVPSLHSAAHEGNMMGTVFVRPEHVVLAPSGTFKDRNNILRGEVHRSIYLGAKSLVHVRLDNGNDLLVEASNLPDQSVLHPPGLRVDAYVAPGAITLLPDRTPEDSLRA
jgi:ABC-type Fe3+/spermidine/putrescine transport system ATPase subunit